MKTLERACLYPMLCQGEFETVGGERVHFGPAPRGYTECRGVVIRGDADQLVREWPRAIYQSVVACVLVHLRLV